MAGSFFNADVHHPKGMQELLLGTYGVFPMMSVQPPLVVTGVECPWCHRPLLLQDTGTRQLGRIAEVFGDTAKGSHCRISKIPNSYVLLGCHQCNAQFVAPRTDAEARNSEDMKCEAIDIGEQDAARRTTSRRLRGVEAPE